MRVRERPDVQRAKIIAAATELFATHGFAHVTADDVAREAGIRRTLLYHYFASREDILEAVVLDPLDQLERMLQGLLEHGGAVEEQIRYVIDGYYEIMTARSGLAKLLIDSATLLARPAYQERIGRLRQSLLDWVDGLRPWIRDLDREQFLLIVVGALFIWLLPTPFARAFGADPALAGLPLDRHKAALCDLLLHGLVGNSREGTTLG